MEPTREMTVQVNVRFSDRSLARPVLEDLGRNRALVVNIVRGRITQEEASFDLEVTGSRPRIDDLLRRNARWGASIRMVPAGVA